MGAARLGESRSSSRALDRGGLLPRCLWRGNSALLYRVTDGFGGGRGALRFLLRGSRRFVKRLIASDGAGARHHMNGSRAIRRHAEGEHKALRYNRLGGGGVRLHVGGGEGEILFAADAPQLRHQHERPQVLHASAIVKEHPQPVWEAGIRPGGGRCGRLGGGSGTGGPSALCPVLNFDNQAINFFKQFADVIR
ncbi:hypothetical protein SDC9_85861 [bioreactor metagenome]|uniref:Uncharacterized protein n=1 Tax=bioreactor metagenome TaxID=1076179 RepID=A0A644ZFZ2_9ZZZZ